MTVPYRMVRRAVDRWLAPVPADRTALVRTVIVAYALLFLIGRSAYLWQAAGLPVSQWRPVGLLGPLGVPPPAWTIAALWAGCVGAAGAVLAGRRRRGAMVALAAGFLLLETYDTSWGQLFHTGHLVALHLLVLAGAALLDPLAVAGRASATPPPPGEIPPMVSGWPLRLLSVVTALTYLLAGVAKLRLGGWDWLDGAALRNQVAYDNIRKELVGSVSSPFAGSVLAQTWWWGPIALATLVVELGAPVAVLWRPARRWWAAAAWAFHVGIVALMAIVFAYPLSGAAYASLLELERPLWWWRRRRIALAASPPARRVDRLGWPPRGDGPKGPIASPR